MAFLVWIFPDFLKSKPVLFYADPEKQTLYKPLRPKIYIEYIPQIKSFAEENKATLSSAKREVKQAIETTEANVKWMENNYDIIKAWLEKQN